MTDKKKVTNIGATNPGAQSKRTRADGVPENTQEAVNFTQRFIEGIIEAPLKLKEMMERNKRGR